mgnify:FL=1|tara:strand:+ start:1582 stop:3861 length:2280 start_codon:yes stop_codon:yes gene_type:complete
MIDLNVLNKRGVTTDSLKKIFGGEDRDVPDEAMPLLDKIRDRIDDGLHWCIKNHKIYHALDLAWDAPFKQVSPTLANSILNKDLDEETVTNAVHDWGLTSMLEDVEDSKGTRKSLNIPVFFNVFVPIVRSYVTIRWARMYNDRRQYPLFKYEMGKHTTVNKLREEIITDRVQAITNSYGYNEVLKQSIFQMLHYGWCMQFPQEEWHSEKQVSINSNGEEEERYVREGIRYHMPHPSRTFFDQAHRPTTFNTDSGCTFAGYWRIMRYGDIRTNKMFWNTDKINYGKTTDLLQSAKTYLELVSPCTMEFPSTSKGVGLLDREKELDRYYSKAEDDKAVLVTEYFEKIIPSEYGLGDYDYPVWFRFCLANDDTILHAAPIPYCPVVYYAYDPDEGRSLNASLSMEIVPFQDQIGNLLTQYLLSVKQNLANITFVDTDQVSGDVISRLQNWGEKLFRTLNFLPFSSRQQKFAQTDVREAFNSVRFTSLDTNGIVGAMRQVIDMLERLLVISAQEIAQVASHEQTAEEVRTIASTTTTRLAFTATGVDDAMNAWKEQLYKGLMAYGEDEVYATINSQNTVDALNELGFTVTEKDDDRSGSVRVKGQKTALDLETIGSYRDALDRVSDGAMANALSQLYQVIIGDQEVRQSIGVDQVLDVINQMGQMMGLPKDFKLQKISDSGSPEQQEQMVQIAEQIKASIMEEVGGAIQPLSENTQQNTQAISQILDALQPPQPPQEEQYDSSVEVPGGGQQVNPTPELVEAR